MQGRLPVYLWGGVDFAAIARLDVCAGMLRKYPGLDLHYRYRVGFEVCYAGSGGPI